MLDLCLLAYRTDRIFISGADALVSRQWRVALASHVFRFNTYLDRIHTFHQPLLSNCSGMLSEAAPDLITTNPNRFSLFVDVKRPAIAATGGRFGDGSDFEGHCRSRNRRPGREADSIWWRQVAYLRQVRCAERMYAWHFFSA